MGTHNICTYKEVDKKYTGRNRYTTALLDCALIGVYVLIRLNMVNMCVAKSKNCWMSCSVGSDLMPHSMASDVGLHHLLRPVCSNKSALQIKEGIG